MIRKFRFSKSELIQIFAFCVIATHSWTLVNMFRDVASWSLSLSLWDLIGSVSYTLIALLFETLVFFLFLVAAGVLLPRRWFGQRLATLSGVIVPGLTILAISVKTHIRLGFEGETVLLFAVLLVALSLIAFLVMRIKGIDETFKRIAEPLTMLAFLYIFVDLLGLLIVIIRNI